MSGWDIARVKSASDRYKVLHVAHRPHPELPGHAETIIAPTKSMLRDALRVHGRLDELRGVYGSDWVFGADTVMPDGVIRWVWAAPRAPGRPGLRPVPSPAALKVLLAEAAGQLALTGGGGEPHVSPAFHTGLLWTGAGTPDP